jgi:spore coat polysaccharide biosynthesis protein SpsF (cytidylyltransferase family)
LRRPEIRLTVDTAEDLARTRAILAGFADSRPTLAEIVAFVDRTAGA